MNLASNAVQTPSPTRRRVLFVDHAAVMGGAELSLLDLAIAYRDTSRVLLFDQGPFRERLEGANVPVQVIAAPSSLLSVKASGGLSALKAIPGLGWMARRIVEQSRGVDLIHANSQKAFVAAALARWMGAPPVVWHLRDILTASHFSAMNRRLAIALANAQASQVMVNSQATGEAFVAAGGRPDLVHLVYNGLSAQPFDAVGEEQAIALRQELGLGADVPIIGSFSRLSYWKGQHVLLEAVRSLPEVQVLLVGKSLFGEDEYVAQLQDLAASPELAGRVHWVGFRTDIPALMKACSIVAHTSTEPEPFGRVIVEGQLAQRPVIATAAGGAVELVEDGVTGRLVPPKDAIALRQAIHEILEHPQQTADLAQRGYDHAKATFSLESLLTNFDHALSLI
ncbi:MAG: glycosyltransferase family 4 protein [Synechococcales cyanobacterium K44_A2020_017]|nr:glycosyltransferase family 4 protein [Synechococcales cyanobacterium K32_A2020_035]MBF2095194.1 glycosyltransferase family 4 protein [Synechococcales cyanobacterium K44_A2020_017]